MTSREVVTRFKDVGNWKPKRRKRLRVVGSKGRTHRDRMDELRPVVMARATWRCEARVEGVCVGTAHHAHHVWPSGRGGPDVLENLIAVCGACHDWIHHVAPAAARERGLLRSSLPETDDAA